MIEEFRSESVRALARTLETDVNAMYVRVQKLKELGLVTTIGGRPKRPVIACDGFTVECIFGS